MMGKYYKEFVTFPDITIMLILFAPLMVYTALNMFQIWIWIAFIIGMAGYAMSEYMIHRFLFHMKTPTSPFLLRMIKRLHFDHHVDPKNLKLLFLPIWFSLPNFFIASIIVYLITANLQITIAFLAGIVAYFLYIMNGSIILRISQFNHVRKWAGILRKLIFGIILKTKIFGLA